MGKLMESIKKNPYYLVWFKDAWPYITGAVLLSVFQVATLAVTGSPWGVTGAFANLGAWLYRLAGGVVDKWYYFSGEGAPGSLALLEGGILKDAATWRNAGLVAGALFATLAASGFKFKKIKGWRQALAAVLGGLLMGYGARIAFGCNIGALYSGIASLSLSGWVFGVFLFVGAIIGSRLLVKHFMD